MPKPSIISGCPFCSKVDVDNVDVMTDAKGFDAPTAYWAECKHCHARGPVAGTIEDAWRYWNATDNLNSTMGG